MFYVVKFKGHTVDMSKNHSEMERSFKFGSNGTELWQVQSSGAAKLLQVKQKQSLSTQLRKTLVTLHSLIGRMFVYTDRYKFESC